MHDLLGLLNSSIPLQERYDKFLLWKNENNFTSTDLIAQALGLIPAEVDVYFELGNLEEDEFSMIDSMGFDIGMLFLIVRAEKRTRKKIYNRHPEIIGAVQPMRILKSMVDEDSNLSTMEDLVKRITGNCWLSIARYLKDRKIVEGTITVKIRSMLFNAGRFVNSGKEISPKMIDWIIRAIYHDKSIRLGVFTNDTVRTEFHDDYVIFKEIHEVLDHYEDD